MKLKEIKKLYSKKDDEHGWKHILKVKRNVNVIKKSYVKTNKNLLDFLILFHGLKEYVDKNKNKFDKNYIVSLKKSHTKPKKIEEKLVFDANQLINVGDSGVKKAIKVGEKIGRNKEKTFDYIKKKLEKLEFYTPLGKKIGKQEINKMKTNLK